MSTVAHPVYMERAWSRGRGEVAQWHKDWPFSACCPMIDESDILWLPLSSALSGRRQRVRQTAPPAAPWKLRRCLVWPNGTSYHSKYVYIYIYIY